MLRKKLEGVKNETRLWGLLQKPTALRERKWELLSLELLVSLPFRTQITPSIINEILTVVQQLQHPTGFLLGGSQSSIVRKKCSPRRACFKSRERKCSHCELEWQGRASYLVENMLRQEGGREDRKGQAEKGGMMMQTWCLICRMTADMPTWS